MLLLGEGCGGKIKKEKSLEEREILVVFLLMTYYLL